MLPLFAFRCMPPSSPVDAILPPPRAASFALMRAVAPPPRRRLNSPCRFPFHSMPPRHAAAHRCCDTPGFAIYADIFTPLCFHISSLSFAAAFRGCRRLLPLIISSLASAHISASTMLSSSRHVLLSLGFDFASFSFLIFAAIFLLHCAFSFTPWLAAPAFIFARRRFPLRLRWLDAFA